MSYHRSNKILLLAVAVLLSVFSLANAAKVLDITVKKAEGVTQVIVTGDDVLDYKDFTLTNPDRLVVDIKGGSIAFGNKTMTVNKGGITTISTSQFDREGGIARIVIEMADKPNYLLMAEESDLIIALATKDISSFAEWKATAAPSEMAAATPVPQAPVPPSMPSPPPPMVEEVPSSPVVPVTSTPPPSTPALVMEEQPAAPPLATPSTPPPVIEERPATPSYPTAPPAPPEKMALPATPIQPKAAYVESQKPRYRSVSSSGLSGGRSVSMDLENADVITVLRAMAEYSGRNMIVGSDIKGSVSMRLHNVSWARAFEEIVKAAGLVVEESGGIIRVMSPRQATENIRMREQGQELVTVVYPIEFAVANEIIGSLSKILSSRGSIQVDKRTNALVINEVSYKQTEIAELIRLLDTATLQVEIMARIVDVDMDASKDLGISWDLANIASYDYNAELQSAIVPELLASGTRPSLKVGTMRSFAQLNATLSILETKRKANTISNPRITVVNNKEAKIVGGKKIPISLRDESGNTVTSMYTIGMVLTTTPHINSAENITLDVKTEISDLDPTATILGGVVILTNEATTQIVLNDGETAVIGGLLQTKAGKTQSGIPILMDIPIIGALFRSTTTSTAKREILIFLTPHIIKSK